jgi:hypothetical protein
MSNVCAAAINNQNMIQDFQNPSANMESQPQNMDMGQPGMEPRIPRRVDPSGQPMPGHRLDEPRPTEESMERQNTPKQSGIFWRALPYLIPAMSVGIGASVAMALGIPSK